MTISLCPRAETTLAIDVTANEALNLSPWLYYSQAPTSLGIDDIQRLSSSQWHKITPDETSGIGNRSLWIKFSIYSTDANKIQRIISLANPHLDHILLYHFNRGELIDQIEMGDSLIFSRRPIIHNDFLYLLTSQADDFHTFYLKINTQGTASLPLTIWPPATFLQDTEKRSLVHGFQLGVLMAIGLFSLFIALTTRSFSYSYYACFVLSITLFVAALHGIAFRFLWPNWPVIQQFILPLMLSVSMIFGFLFSEKVLQLKYHNRRMLQLCRYGAAYSLLLLLAGPFLAYTLSLKITIVSVLIATLVLMCIAVIQGLKGHKLAKLFIFGWSGMLLGSFISGLMYLGLLQFNMQAKTPFMLGLSFGIVFMAVVLAIRYNDERKAKLQIQQEALAQAEHVRQTREEALLVESRSNEKLEQMVQERTLELEIALRELNEANQKLTEQATIDSLTGVKNRNAFDKRLSAEGRISRRQQTPMAILMLDIDRFKSINDTFGHLAGDQTLRVIAQELKRNLKRPTDLVSRFGGEEFAIILPNTAEEGALQVAEFIREAISKLPISWDAKTIPLTISIGVSAEVITTEEHTTLLLEQADKALYRAKNEGRNRVMLYTPEQDMTSP